MGSTTVAINLEKITMVRRNRRNLLLKPQLIKLHTQ